MGRTLPSASQVINQAEQSFGRFRRALRQEDQCALDELCVYSHKHVAEIAFAANPLPVETIFLSMLVEEHKEVMRLRLQIEEWIAARSLEKSIEPLGEGGTQQLDSASIAELIHTDNGGEE